MGVYVWAWVRKYGWVTGCKCRCGVVGRVWEGVVGCGVVCKFGCGWA